MCERQMKPIIEQVKVNHLERYLWAIRELKKRDVHTVLDAAAGVGYGSYMLGNAGFEVHAIDISKEAVDFHNEHYKHPRVRFEHADILKATLGDYDAIVTIETIEHVPHEWVERLKAPVIVATVPNQRVVPFDETTHKYHLRHYTQEEFDELIPGSKQWFTQYGKWDNAKMVPGSDGMTLGAVIER